VRSLVAAFLGLTLLVALACGDDADRDATPTLAPDSGVTGVASVGPTCPVERPDSPCPDRPFEGEIVVTDRDGTEVARTTTDASGRFTVALPPGDYVVRSEVTGGLPAPAGVEVSVRAGAYVAVELRLDSGIR
jgi:hypothetical protein